jgi:ureidoacrylate peracid hydrolase
LQENDMHPFVLPEDAVARAVAHRGAAHVFGKPDPAKTALVVIDMQNYFVAPGYLGEVPMARAIVQNINRLAAAMRAAKGRVVWVQNSTDDTRQSWSVVHDHLMTPERRERRWATMTETNAGFLLWPELDARPEDDRIVKKRYSAFLQGASPIEAHLRALGIDTLLIAGTATNVCCESSARDAMMLNFKVAMISDACAAGSDEAHAASLLGFYSIFGDVLTVDEAIAGLGAKPAAAKISAAA